MFTSLKNKIRDETGNDLSKLTSRLTTSTVQKIESLRGRCEEGSSSSINSLISSDGAKEDVAIDSEEVRKLVSKVETEYCKKMDQKELEFREQLNEKNKYIQSLESENKKAFQQIADLQRNAHGFEELKVKLSEQQESEDYLENLQSKELNQIKCILLQREKELAEKTALLKDVSNQLDTLRSEVSRLRKQEEQLSDLQQNTLADVKTVERNMENAENLLSKSSYECQQLRTSIDVEHATNTSLREMISKLQLEHEEEQNMLANVQRTLTRVTTEKNAALLRNAEISQQVELLKQERKRQESEMKELFNKVVLLEKENNEYKEYKCTELQLRNKITELEEQSSEKSKNIKTLQLRLADMKKTLQYELKSPPNPAQSDMLQKSPPILAPSHVVTRNLNKINERREENINLQYLKHVILKFLTCRGHEINHLTKALSMLLQFTVDEERLVIETVEWRNSWFGSRPKLGFNNTYQS